MRVSEHLPVVNADPGLQGMTLNEFLEILWKSRWAVAAILSIFSVVGLLHISFAQPVYRSDALLQVGQQSAGTGLLGGSRQVSQVFEATTVEMEMELLKSRMVLGQVADQFDLDISVQPVHFPIVRDAIPWFDKLEKVAAPWFNLGARLDLNGWLNLDKYARGDESIEIARLDIPTTFRGQVFTVVAGDDDTFEVHDSDGTLLAKGKVGTVLPSWLPTEKPHALVISELKARPGTHFKISRSLRLAAITGLAASMSVTPVGSEQQPGAQAGLLQISLQGSDPKEITAIINRTVDIYTRQSAERKSAEVKRSLEFLEEQLPKVKARAERAEAALNDYLVRQGSVDMQMETQTLLGNIAAVEDELSRMIRRREALLRKFTPRHDRVIAFDAELAGLEERESALEREVHFLPRTQQDILRLRRNVESSGQLYADLRNSLQHLNVVKAGTSGDVQVIDKATVPYAPVGPIKKLTMVIYLSLGMVSGVGMALLRKGLLRGKEPVEDPDAIEKKLGLPVYAVVPHSAKQHKLSKKRRLRGKRRVLLSGIDAEDIAVESVRSLRTWLNFAFVDAKNNVLLITGPGPGVGKSFLSINLAVVLADASKRVLVIDADLRKGHLHRHLNLEREPGLSDAITGTIDTGRAILKTDIDNLFVVPTGTLPPNPSELLQRKRFASIVEEVSAEFDYVVIDSPPALAVTDAAVIGRMAAGALLVLKAKTHPLREIEQCVKHLRRSGVNLLGVVFNDMDTSSRRYGYAKYYGYADGGYYRAK
ncbi:MAG: polysaccharide biosynthesis tyrosine autokinase [Gammaproteobacteria bacterium]